MELRIFRYAIDDSAADWSQAEAQIANLGSGKATVVSVKGTQSAPQKRKAETVADMSETKSKKSRRSMKGKQR